VKLLQELLKQTALLESNYDTVGYDTSSKNVFGGIKEFAAKYGLTPEILSKAVDDFAKTDLCKKLEAKCGKFTASSVEKKHGTISFGNPKTRNTYGGAGTYNIYCTGQIRKCSFGGQTTRLRVPSPFKLIDKNNSPEQFIAAIYKQAGEALLAKTLPSIEQSKKERQDVNNFSKQQLTEIPKVIMEIPKSNWPANLNIEHNRLTTLNGLPDTISGDFNASHNSLKTLKGLSKTIAGTCLLNYNELDNFEGIKDVIVDGSLILDGNNFTSLKGIEKAFKSVNGSISLRGNKIQANVLGLLKIKGCKKVKLSNDHLESILNKYLPEGDLFDCQEELIEAGLDKLAQL
jgi:hypothetical protein